jgi:hypothetical protein
MLARDGHRPQTARTRARSPSTAGTNDLVRRVAERAELDAYSHGVNRLLALRLIMDAALADGRAATLGHVLELSRDRRRQPVSVLVADLLQVLVDVLR